MSHWDEVHGFVSIGEYSRFVTYIEEQVAGGLAEEVEVDGEYGRGLIYGGRWFKDIATGETWRLIPPDGPFLGLWERVLPDVDRSIWEILAKPRSPE